MSLAANWNTLTKNDDHTNFARLCSLVKQGDFDLVIKDPRVVKHIGKLTAKRMEFGGHIYPCMFKDKLVFQNTKTGNSIEVTNKGKGTFGVKLVKPIKMDSNEHKLYAFLRDKRVEKLMKESYAHVKLPFTQEEATDFLAGKDGEQISRNYYRSNQIDQTISVVGNRLVDRKKVDVADHLYTTYKMLWKLKTPATCPCCNRKYQTALLFQQPTCGAARCQLQYMRDNI